MFSIAYNGYNCEDIMKKIGNVEYNDKAVENMKKRISIDDIVDSILTGDTDRLELYRYGEVRKTLFEKMIDLIKG